ncbi:MAG: MMPL family transporter [Gammaproteobacteria bacterium]|nr:MMPL family transporter [Gammaproteobacteria bacterium]
MHTSVAASARASPLERLVALSIAVPSILVLLTVLLCALMARYVTGHFAMTTDTYALLSPNLPWRIRQAAFNAAFPQESSDIVVVIDGQTPELSHAAAAKLAASLRAQTQVFRSVQQADGGAFWDRERLLFASIEDVNSFVAQLLKAQPFLGSMAGDPTMRGLADTLSLTLRGVNTDPAAAQELRTPIRALADALQSLEAGRRQFFSWRTLISGHPADARELRHIVLVNPMLDFAHLQPGKLPIDTIRGTAARLQLDPAHGVRVRLTGPVPLQDEEFATLAQRAGLIATLASGAIVLMLWLAVRSPWLIAAILVTTLVGLLTATALGLALFHRFNVISVAFIPLFVGMGMDLGIQFSVRYRAERGGGREVGSALLATGRTMGKSLTLAAAAIGAGFLAFTPTAYYGVSQLGVIAGLGMFTALALNLTLLPALIALTRAPGAPERPSTRLALIDNYVLAHRVLVVGTGVVAALVCAALLPFVQFDFNPIHLRSARVESVATLVDLLQDPDLSPNTLEVIRPDLAAADDLAVALRSDPTVYSARTLSSFIPTAQTEKIAIIADAVNLIDLTLNPIEVAPPPSAAQTRDSLRRAATRLREAAAADPTLRADAPRLAAAFDTLAAASPQRQAAAEELLIPGFVTTLGQIRDSLQPQPVTIAMLPPEIVRAWLAADGRARVSAQPRGNSNDDVVLRRFTAAGLKIAPDATGTAIYLQAYGQAVVDAFIEAGVLSFVAISALLLFALRRIRDVAITMAPIVLTGLLTMGTCVLIGQPLNFANIIALPLLFGIGVAFHIYFVMSWRSGGSHLLTSSLARGVFFSALATATGFGSLWASSHPGTASMGKLLMISLVWTLTSALLFQPALMGPGRPPPAAAAPTSGDHRSTC